MPTRRPDWPVWWEWELDCTNPHLAKRMVDRSFNETDLREMMGHASGLRADVELGRWVIETRHGGGDWEVVVEPDSEAKLLVVVTAYTVR